MVVAYVNKDLDDWLWARKNRETNDWKKEMSVHPWRKTEGLGAEIYFG
jgi:hypothetical protein